MEQTFISVDLSTGSVQLFMSSIPRYNGIIVDPTEQWAYINFGHDAFLLIQDISDTSKHFNPVIDESLGGKVDGFAGVIYLPLKNRFYVTWMTPDTISGKVTSAERRFMMPQLSRESVT